MAYESQDAAFADETAGRLRPAASRFYYSAYQAITALLHLSGRQPPGGEIEDGGREAWSHKTTPEMILTDLNRYFRTQTLRETMRSKLLFLYKMRVIADYIATEEIHKESFVRLATDSRYVVKLVTQTLGKHDGDSNIITITEHTR